MQESEIVSYNISITATSYFPLATVVPARAHSSQTTPYWWQRATTRSYYPQTTPSWQRASTRSYYPQTLPYRWQRASTRSYYHQTTPYRWQRASTRAYYPQTTPYRWQRATTRSYYPQTTPYYWWNKATTRSYYPQTTPYRWQRATTRSYYHHTTPYWQRATIRSYYPQTTPYWQRATIRSYYPTTTPYWWQRATTRSYYPQTTPSWQRASTRSYYPQTTPYRWQRASTRSYYHQTTPYRWQRASTRGYYPQTTPYRWQRATTRSYYPQTTPYWWQRSTTRSYYPQTSPYWWQRATTRSYYPQTTPYYWWNKATTRSYYPQTTPYRWQRATTRSYYHQTTPYWQRATIRSYYPQTSPYWQRATIRSYYPTATPYWWQRATTRSYYQINWEGLQVSCDGGYFKLQFNHDLPISFFIHRNVHFGFCAMYNQWHYSKRTSFSLTGCGTTRTETESHILYSNRIHLAGHNLGVISRTDSSYQVQCKINREAVAENSFITDNATKIYYGEGNYSVDLQFSRQLESGYIYNYPVSINKDQELYGQVRVTGYDFRLNPVIEDCYAKPNQTHSTLVYYLIKNRCVVDSTTKSYGNGTFSFKTFDFIQQHGTVNIICRVYVCTDDDMSYHCTRQCIRRRSVRQRRSETDGKPIALYQGPFVVAVADTDSIVAIATGSAVGGVVVIGFVVAIIVKVKPLLAAAKVAPAGYSSIPQSLPQVA